MPYRKNQEEYLTWEEWQVLSIIKQLVAEGRTGNCAQIMALTGLSRAKVSRITRDLELRSYIRDVGKGAAYHWRCTSKAAQLEHNESEVAK